MGCSNSKQGETKEAAPSTPVVVEVVKPNNVSTTTTTTTSTPSAMPPPKQVQDNAVRKLQEDEAPNPEPMRTTSRGFHKSKGGSTLFNENAAF